MEKMDNLEDVAAESPGEGNSPLEQFIFPPIGQSTPLIPLGEEGGFPLDQIPKGEIPLQDDGNPHPTSLEVATKSKESGNERFKAGEFSEAILIYEEGVYSCPTEASHLLAILHFNMGMSHLMQEEEKEALEHYTQSITADPNYLKPYFQRSMIYKKQTKYEEAIADMKQCILIDPAMSKAKTELLVLEQQQKVHFEKMKNEALGQLKNLGNKLLGNFGISLDNFKMNKNDDGTFNIQYENQ